MTLNDLLLAMPPRPLAPGGTSADAIRDRHFRQMLRCIVAAKDHLDATKKPDNAPGIRQAETVLMEELLKLEKIQ